MELLESRQLLHGADLVYEQVSADWFGAGHQRTDALYSGEAVSLSSFVGPQRTPAASTAATVSQEWILRLTAAAAERIDAIVEADALLDGEFVNFDVVRGLGLPGMLLVESYSDSEDGAARWLAGNDFVADFVKNDLIQGLLDPNDPSFVDMTNLSNSGQFGSTVDADIDAPETWDISRGSATVVVGVIDSGADVAHEDLYLNIWLNQGEIPAGLQSQLSDLDGDGLISFWDLNNLRIVGAQIYVASTVTLDPDGAFVSGDIATVAQLSSATPHAAGSNAALVDDLNGNGRIDSLDLLLDARWSDTVDGDGNGFVDDLFGWNFRSDPSEPFAPNNPSDSFGHGTHVSGTIGAVGNNGLGVVGINWQSSIMPIKFLDAQNRGSSADAIAAINYATMMRDQYGVNVRVTNNSWGHPGENNPMVRAAIAASGSAGILFVAAAGNGDAFGRGSDNDLTPYYPAGYELPNVISVAASDRHDQLATFSNFGSQSVDLAAPGIGVISTLPSDRYGSGNGTSAASSHVAATAALVWSARPNATVDEVRAAILDGADSIAGLQGKVASGGRLNLRNALDSDRFTPAARVVTADDITTSGGATHQVVVEYHYASGIDVTTIGDNDIRISRDWGARERLDATFVSDSLEQLPDGKTVLATYQITAPGGEWDALDFGGYHVEVIADSVASSDGLQFAAGQRIGSFDVRVVAPGVFYVSTGVDSVDVNIGDGVCGDDTSACSLRAAIQEANAIAPNAAIIILDVNEARVDIPHEADPASTFPNPDTIDGLPDVVNETGWSNESSGDLDIHGNVMIVGDQASLTHIIGEGNDRLFKVQPGAELSLQRLTVTGGAAPGDQGGGAILSAGTLNLDLVTVSVNTVVDTSNGIGGGGIAVWGGSLLIQQSTIAANIAEVGGGILISNGATATIKQSTILGNFATAGSGLGAPDPNLIGGGGLVALKSGVIDIENSTFSSNVANNAAGAAIGSYNLVTDAVVESTDVPKIVPDLGSITSQLTVSDFNDVVADVNVRLSIQHTFNSDLQVFLISPSGTRVELFTAVGGSSNDFTDTILDDEALIGIDDGSAPFTGMFRPEGNLSDLIGEDPNGIWSLEVSDMSVNDTGTLIGWTLELKPLEGSETRVNLDHVTAAFNEGASTIDGRVHMHSSLLAGNDGAALGTGVSDLGFNLITDSQSVGQLQLLGGETLVHPLRSGSLAIDGGDPDQFPSVDQSGTSRPQRGGGIFTRADVGAVEMKGGFADGQVFLDRNADGVQDIEELGLPGFQLFVDLNDNGALDPDEPQSVTGIGEARGEFLFSNLAAGPHSIYLQVPDNWTLSVRDTLDNVRMSVEDGNQHSPSLSYDGNTIAFFSDDASGAVPMLNRLLVLNRAAGNYYTPHFVVDFGFPPPEILYTGFDTPSISADGRYVTFLDEFYHPFFPGEQSSIEVVDTRVTEGITAGFSVASELTGFSPSDGMISLDGRHVVFTSNDDVYLFDRQGETFFNLSMGLADGPANGASSNVSISQEGRFVAFESLADNLVEDETNGRADVFVLDRVTQVVERVSIGTGGVESDADVFGSSISSDGRHVVFASAATNLVPDDGNGLTDVFVFDRDAGTTERISSAGGGLDGDGLSQKAAISADGRFVVFESDATNLVQDDPDTDVDVFLFDRDTNTMVRIAASSHSAAISGDGKFVAYVQGTETFVASNPLASVGDRTVILNAGDTVTAPGFGLVPNPGEIRGSLFHDLITNSMRDIADIGLADWTVYLDTSANGQLDEGEPQVVSGADGSYVFPGLPGYASYQVRVEVPDQWQQVLPNPNLSDSQDVFVDAGETVTRVDFGFLPVSTGGVEEASVSGIVFADDGNGVQDPEEPGLEGVTVFLDLNDDGLLQAEEPSVVTDSTGTYLFDGLGQANQIVRVVLPEDSRVSTPAGNEFARSSLAARSVLPTLAGVEDMILVDLDGDAKPDLVSLLYEANLLSIHINGGDGSFATSPIHLPLPPGEAGPIALVATDINQLGSIDLIIVNQLSGTGNVMRDFNGTGFDSVQTYEVGLSPSDVVAADLDGVNGMDFAVTDAASDSITLMLNDGSGGFVRSTIPSGGKRPTAIAVGHFNDDTDLDLAIANFGDHPTGADLGNVTVLINQGGASFASPVSYEAGFGPAAIIAADLNGDGQDDLAVAGHLSNSVALLIGSSTGEFDVLPDSIAVVGGPIQIEAVDIDGDEDTDLIIAGATSQHLSLLRNDLDNGNFTIAPAEQVAASESAADERTEIAIGNVNGDGSSDIVITGHSGETISLLHNFFGGGHFRLALTGVETLTGLNFGIAPALLDSIILEGEGETVDMAALSQSVRSRVMLIDIRGTGNNTLILDTATIQTLTPNQTLRVIADAGDQILFDAAWLFSGGETVEGQFERIFVNGSATLRIVGPRSWTNPVNSSDVNGNGDATAADALAVINALAPGIVVDDQDNLLDPTTVDPARFKFYDANSDGRMTASDALFVINRIGRAQSSSEPEQALGYWFAAVDESDDVGAELDDVVADTGPLTCDKIDNVFASNWIWR